MLRFLGTLMALPLVSAGWQTVYSSNYSQAYVQSTNGSLYSLPVTTQQGQNAQSIYKNLQPIASAPANSSLVLDSDGHLFAVWGSKGCGQSPIEISQYNSKSDQWSTLAQSGFNQLWYQESQIVWLDRSSDVIYFYGGSCKDQTQSGFYSYSLANNTFNVVNGHGGAMPREMAAAQVIPLDDYRTLIIGGRANGAWLSMQQVAIWGYGSWGFSSVANSSGIDSRDDPLLLPMWESGQTEPLSEILVVGGNVVGRDAKPDMVVLSYNETTGWTWGNSYTDSDGQVDLSYAGFTLYETFGDLQPSSRTVSLYGGSKQNLLNPTSNVPVPKSGTKTSGEKKTSPAVVAVVSTVLPILALCAVGALAWWWWRRRQERRLFLLPNRRSMMKMHDRAQSSDTSKSWNIPPLPTHTRGPVNDSGSFVMMDGSEGNQIYMSKQRRNLRVVNPDAEVDFGAGAMAHPIADTVREDEASATGKRESSWSSGSTQDPFADGDNADKQSEFDFNL